MASRDRSRSPMCCRSCAECSCDHRGIITRQNEIIARQARQIAALQMPPRIEPLTNAARAALDVVCKHDADDRVETQRATIARLRQELAAKDNQINELKLGMNVAMGNIWVQHGILFPEFAPNEEHRTSRQDLHSFLAQVRQGLETQIDRALELQILFPMDGEATEDEDDSA